MRMQMGQIVMVGMRPNHGGDGIDNSDHES